MSGKVISQACQFGRHTNCKHLIHTWRGDQTVHTQYCQCDCHKVGTP